MSIQIPFQQHGACPVVLIALKGHPKRVYHYSKAANQELSGAVRDYLRGQIIRSGEGPPFTASEIEALVEYAEEPPYQSVKLIASWKTDCQTASENHFGAAHVDLTSANPSVLGTWRRMNSKGS